MEELTHLTLDLEDTSETYELTDEKARNSLEELKFSSPAIILSASGPDITVTDSAKRPFVQDKIFGKTVQRTTTGAQLIPLLPENLVASDGLTGVINSDGTLTVTGTPVQQHSAVFRKAISLTPGNYYISGGETDPGKVSAQIVITRSDNSIGYAANGDFEAKADDKKYVIVIQTSSPNIQTVNQTLSPMLNKDSSPLPIEPYTGGIASPSMDYPQELDTVGAEKDQIVQEVTGRNLSNVVDRETVYLDIKVNGDVIALSRKNGVAQYSKAIYDLRMLEDGQYTIQYDSLTGNFLAGNIVEIRDIDDSILLTLSPNKTKDTRLLKAGKYKMIIFSGNTTQDTAMITGLRLTRSEDIPWEPYQSPQQLIIPIDGGLPGIPVKAGGNYTDEDGQQWIANYVDLERGKLIKLVDKEVISGTPNFTESSDTPGRFIYNALQTARYKTGAVDCLSNFAHCIYYGIPANNKWVFAVSGKALYVSPPKDSGITAENLNTMFTEMIASDTPPVIIGQLKTPEEIDLDPETIAAYKALHSNYPSTVVSNQDGAWQEIEYVADTKAYIENQISKAVTQAVTLSK